MSPVTLEEAHARLPQLIEQLAAGEEVAITRDSQTIARLVGAAADGPRAVFGRGRGKVVVVSEDEEHLQTFHEYMP